MTEERYARQVVIEDWNQDSLSRARVVVVGSGMLAGCIGWGLAALGVGEICLLDDGVVAGASPAFPCLEASPGESTAESLANTLMTLNPNITARGIPFRLLYRALAPAIPDCDVLVEATDDRLSKQICQEYGGGKGIPVILASTGETGGRYAIVRGGDQVPLQEYLACGNRQGIVPSQVIGGLVLEEVRQLLMPLPKDTPFQSSLHYDLSNPRRFGSAGGATSVPAWRAGRRHCLVIGAGALGTYVSLGLALSGVSKLTIVDPDVVEETNLNRQVLFYDSVGRPKASELARKLEWLCPGLRAVAIQARVARNHLEDVDLMFLCVDNFQTRALVNRFAGQLNIPLVNGGTSAFGGEVAVYNPGETTCLDCRLGVNRLASEEKDAGSRASCGHVAEASIVNANAIIGGLMVGEAGTLFSPKALGSPLPGIIEYDAFSPSRVGMRSERVPCRCHSGEEP
jgi:molybdopterin/thiamine biosynthesis adenylyltransferase